MSSKKPDTYERLTDLLDKWFDKSWHEIPGDIQKTITRNLPHWDLFSPDERRVDAGFQDLQHDPATEDERENDFLIPMELLPEAERKLSQLEDMKPDTVEGMEKKDKYIAELKEQIIRMKEPFAHQPQQQNDSTDSAERVFWRTRSVNKKETLQKHFKYYVSRARSIREEYPEFMGLALSNEKILIKVLKSLNEDSDLKKIPTEGSLRVIIQEFLKTNSEYK